MRQKQYPQRRMPDSMRIQQMREDRIAGWLIVLAVVITAVGLGH